MEEQFNALKEFIPVPWDTFSQSPESVQQAMITMAESQRQAAEERHRLDLSLQKYKDEEAQRAAEAAEAEAERIRQEAYDAQKQREFEYTVKFMREMKTPHRVAFDTTPRKQFSVKDELDISCEFPDHEPQPLSLLNGHLIGYRKETIYNLEDTVTEMVCRALECENTERSPKAYMMFHIWTGGQRRVCTRVVNALIYEPVTGTWKEQVDKLYEGLDDMLSDIERVKTGYEYIYEGAVSYIHFYVVVRRYPSPKCVTNWGAYVKDVEKYEYFDLFTANDANVPCILQCARRLFGADATEDTLEKIIKRADEKVCIVGLHATINGISSIVDYSDLRIDPFSPVKSLNIIDPDVKYLLHYDCHVGVLENLKEPKRNRNHTKFRPMSKFPKCKKVTVAFDIECYFDPNANQKHIPYLCCACFIYDDTPGNVIEFEDKDCIAQMIDYSAKIAKEFGHQHIELIAHNGGGYDFHYLLSSIWNPCAIKNIMIRNNNFISFMFKHGGIQFSVKDSYNFLGCSLANAAKSFLGPQERKTDYPHHEVKTAEDLAKIYDEWISVEQIISVNVEKEKMIITDDHIIRYANRPESKSLLEWSRIYCCNDVIVLAKVWVAFKQTVFDVFGCYIVDNTYTLAGLSFRLFEAHLPPHIKLEHQKRSDFDNMREALIGGRCISMNGMYEDVACLDVKSLYPAAMAYYEQPYGKTRRVRQRVDNELGIYYVKVTPYAFNQERGPRGPRKHGYFPLKSDGQVCYKDEIAVPYKAWYTSVDIDIGNSEGHKIEYIPFDGEHVGYSWKEKGKIFKEYIQEVLYKLKLQYEEEGNKEKRFAIKIIMNSLWGKFAQKWMDTTYKIIHEDDFEEDMECYKIFDTESLLVKGRQQHKISSKPVQNGVFTLSWARHHMKRIWDASAKPGAECLYSDTDSIFVRRNEIDMDAVFEIDGKEKTVIGDEMGQLEVECVFDKLICVGKKQYMGSCTGSKGQEYKKRFKGVPQQYVVPQLFAHLIEHPDRTAQINFLKFKREWGCVNGYIESKIVRQT